MLSAKIIEQILTEQFEATRDGDTLLIADDRRLTFIIALAGGQTLQVARVRRVRQLKEHLELVAEERYYLANDTVIGLRGADPSEAAEKRPGFFR